MSMTRPCSKIKFGNFGISFVDFYCIMSMAGPIFGNLRNLGNYLEIYGIFCEF